VTVRKILITSLDNKGFSKVPFQLYPVKKMYPKRIQGRFSWLTQHSLPPKAGGSRRPLTGDPNEPPPAAAPLPLPLPDEPPRERWPKEPDEELLYDDEHTRF